MPFQLALNEFQGIAPTPPPKKNTYSNMQQQEMHKGHMNCSNVESSGTHQGPSAYKTLISV